MPNFPSNEFLGRDLIKWPPEQNKRAEDAEKRID